MRTRCDLYLSPEQLRLGEELDGIAGLRNGKLDDSSPEILEFAMNSRDKIKLASDVYSVGAMLFRLLMGQPPSPEISDHIHKKRLNDKTPDANVYEVPFFLKDFILSNDMCYILIKLLNQQQKHRY